MTAFLSNTPPDLELALQAARQALDWRTALWLAQRLEWDQSQKARLARDMAHDLAQQQGSREASREAATLLVRRAHVLPAFAPPDHTWWR